jgi:Divalent cation transporter
MGLTAFALYRSVPLGLVMAAAVLLNLLVAAFTGTAVPLLLRRLGRDPAQGSSVLLTFTTDSMGFFIFLGLASVFLRYGVDGYEQASRLHLLQHSHRQGWSTRHQLLPVEKRQGHRGHATASRRGAVHEAHVRSWTFAHALRGECSRVCQDIARIGIGCKSLN